MKKLTKILAFGIALIMLLSFAACNSETSSTDNTTNAPAETTSAPVETTSAPDTTSAPETTNVVDLPRNETLYISGLQWGAVKGWNPLSSDNNNALAVVQQGGGTRVVMFETPYMYNMLDGSLVPLLADGDYQWNDDKTELSYKIKDAAKWNDGTPVTADDAVATWQATINNRPDKGAEWTPYIGDVVATDSSTVTVKAVLTDDGKPANTMMMLQFIEQQYIIQKAWLDTLIERNGGDTAKIVADPAEDAVWSGPYHNYFADDTKVVLIRDDNYWGQDASMWGKLPAPKYLVHTIYADNNAGQVALAAGQVDACQQFIANVQDMWLKDGLPISTYLPDPPYGLCVNMPTAWFNTSSPGLDNPVIRKAIAIAVDYDAVNANAMTGQSPTFAEVPRSLMSPLPTEQAMYNKDDAEVKDLQWVGNDIDGANKMLDDAGIVDTDGDGIRELDGENLVYNACCPNGWSDWQASMEIVAEAGKNIGIDISTEFPEADVFQTTVTSASQTQYDIFMMWTDSSTPSQPWSRIRKIMSSEFNGVEGNWSGNWGHYSNPRADELIKAIPLETDENAVKDMYTELVKIYLTDVPSFSLMYRPDQFHVVNESVWTGFTEQGDGRNVPPGHCTDGYAVADLYNLQLVEQ